MQKDFGLDIQANIRAARTYRGIPPEQYLVTYPNFAGLLERWAAETPRKIYLVHYDAEGKREEFTYSEINTRVNQIANFLASELGLRRGDRVATIGYNHSELVMLYFACWKLGVTVVPQNIAEDDANIGYSLRSSGAVIVFARPDLLARAEAIVHGKSVIQSVREIVQVGGEKQGSYRHLGEGNDLQPTDFKPPEPVTLEDEALLVYTSGTTGRPKGVVLTQYNMLVDAKGLAVCNGLTVDQRLMCVLPIHHVYGLIVSLVMPLLAGASVVLNRAYSSEHFWGRMAREKVNIVSVVPTLLQFSLEYADKARQEGRSIWGEGVDRSDLTHLRHVICGGGTLAVALALRFEEVFGFPVIHAYGQSESTCAACSMPPDLSREQRHYWLSAYGYPSIGVPLEINEMAIFDSDGRGEQLPPGQRGEICIRGHNVMRGYDQRPDANAEAFKFGWFRSGDEGFYEVDEQGRYFFFITGRIKELIERGGVKFSPFDIEEVLLELPQIKIALAVGFENDYYGEEVGAFVVLHDGAALTEQEILDHCRARMTFEKSPKVVVFGQSAPMTATGKYQRLMLKVFFEKWRHVQFRSTAG